MAPPLVTLLTDFGAGSGYPAQMKAVLLAALPDAQLVDLSHEVPPYDVLRGALLLEACAPRFPPGAVHLAVVDPGVGTARRALALADRAGRRFVGPDNGLFTPFLEGAEVRALVPGAGPVPRPASATFHGRDLFAPVAAFLAGGGALASLGPEVKDAVRLRWPRAERADGEVRGECLAADPFGNVITSITEADLAPPLGPGPAEQGGGEAGRGPRAPPDLRVDVAGLAARFVTTYGEGAPGELLALVGNAGRLEIAVRQGSAAARLGGVRGTPVHVRRAR